MKATLVRSYVWLVTVVLLAQGVSTLLALTVPAIDRRLPALLQQTQMVPAHSLLHIATGLAGLGVLLVGGRPWAHRFAVAFGLFYLGLSIAGELSGSPLCLGLKRFDHPFHAVLGALGLLAAAFDRGRA